MRYFIITLFSLLLSTPTHSHDQWANGNPVPPWVKQYCCGPNDVHSYDYYEVRITTTGYKLPNYPSVIPFNKALPSQDDRYWAFFGKQFDGTPTAIYCFFVPPSSM